MEIKRSGSQSSNKGPADWFTGTVRIDSPFKGSAPARVTGAIVTFEPGARTAWHTHPLGQVLHILSGVGRVQCHGGPVLTVHSGDTVVIQPSERHWHGAAPGHAMSHLAMQETDDNGEAVTWLEPVTDAEYNG